MLSESCRSAADAQNSSSDREVHWLLTLKFLMFAFPHLA